MEYTHLKSQPKHNNLFNFISYNTDAEITVNNNTKLITGVSIKEDLFYSSALSGENSELYFLLKNNKKISVKSKSFLIDDQIFLHRQQLLNYMTIMTQYIIQW